MSYGLKETIREVYDSYKYTIDAYTQGHSGACIEACRTCVVSLFAKYKGTENFSKWMRGTYNTSGDSATATVSDLDKSLKADLRKEDSEDFSNKNKEGKLTKTKTVYIIYRMM